MDRDETERKIQNKTYK